MVIKHNMAAENSARMRRIISGQLTGSSEKLASGYRVNRAADDAAGLSISEKMRFQIRGLDRGSANIDEGIGYCQVADGALGEMQSMLQRMNELCIQAANGTLSQSDRKYIDDEIQALKEETDRICQTTKFNDEYLFRCEDIIDSIPHDVYKMQFSGRPTDLFIYTDDVNPNSYAGVSFRGRRYAWDEINPPNIYNKDGTFNDGRYSLRSKDDNVELVLNVKEGGKGLPAVSRIFKMNADTKGIYVNGDLMEWGKDIKQSGDTYRFDYHGMTISFTKNFGDTFDDMLKKISGTEWESTYDMELSGASKALDAEFTDPTYRFTSNASVERYLQGPNEKYILHAVDGNNNGKITNPDGTKEPFDGIWLEGVDINGNKTGQLYKKTWKELGFVCEVHKDSGNCDWGTGCTGIWVGNDKEKDPNNYPPWDNRNINYNYDPYNTFSYKNKSENNELVEFKFSVLNEISKAQAVNALNGPDVDGDGIGDGIEISYSDMNTDNNVRATVASGNNVKRSYITYKNTSLDPLSLMEEYLLGRDYGNGKSPYELASGKLEYNGKDRFFVKYPYDANRCNKMNVPPSGNVTFSGIIDQKGNSNFIPNLEQSIITGKKINTDAGGNITIGASNETVTIGTTLSKGGVGWLSLTFESDISGFFGVNGTKIVETPNADNGKYVKIWTGTEDKYAVYNPNTKYVKIQVGTEDKYAYASAVKYVKIWTGTEDKYAVYNSSAKYVKIWTGTEDKYVVDAPGVDYVMTKDGKYALYVQGVHQEIDKLHLPEPHGVDSPESLWVDPPEVNPLWVDPPRYNVSIQSKDGKSLDRYFEEEVYPGIANATTLKLNAYYPTYKLSKANEIYTTVNFTRYKAPVWVELEKPPKPIEEKTEYLVIQCSSNKIDNIAIQKHRLSVYRLGLRNLGTLSEMQATGGIDTVGRALTKVNSIRSRFGAYQNRLEHAYDINRNTYENTQSAESVIRDTDMADEMVRFSNGNILQQAADAMLAQANQSSQGVMALLV